MPLTSEQIGKTEQAALRVGLGLMAIGLSGCATGPSRAVQIISESIPQPTAPAAIKLNTLPTPTYKEPATVASQPHIIIEKDLGGDIGPDLSSRLTQDAKDYVGTFGCPVPEVSFDKRNLSDIKARLLNNTGSVKVTDLADSGVIYFDTDEMRRQIEPKAFNRELELYLLHALTHACVIPQTPEDIPPIVISGGYKILPARGLAFQIFKSDSTLINPSANIFEEGVAEYLKEYLAKKKQFPTYTTSTQNMPYYYLSRMVEAIATNGTKKADDNIVKELAREVQYSDLYGFISLVRGIDRNSNDLTANDFEKVMNWFSQAASAKSWQEFEQARSDMMKNRGQKLSEKPNPYPAINSAQFSLTNPNQVDQYTKVAWANRLDPRNSRKFFDFINQSISAYQGLLSYVSKRPSNMKAVLESNFRWQLELLSKIGREADWKAINALV